jgi:hypothetical protein
MMREEPATSGETSMMSNPCRQQVVMTAAATMTARTTARATKHVAPTMFTVIHVHRHRHPRSPFTVVRLLVHFSELIATPPPRPHALVEWHEKLRSFFVVLLQRKKRRRLA